MFTYYKTYKKLVKLTFTSNADTTVPVYYTKESFIAKQPDETITLKANEQKTTVINKSEIYRFGLVDYDPSTGKRISSNTNIVSAKIEGTILDGHRLFDSVTALTECNVSKMDTSKMISMYGMFNQDRNLSNLDVSNFDTSNVTNMRIMFQGCYNINELDVSHFNTSNVTDMSNMFMSTTTYGGLPMKFTKLDVSRWDTSNVISMNSMFQCCQNLISLDVSNWNTSKVTDMGFMFNSCTALTILNVSNWNISNVISTDHTFADCTSLTTIGPVDTAPGWQHKPNNYNDMFKHCPATPKPSWYK